MKRMLLTLSTLLVAMSMPLAAERVEGYLIDKACSAKVAEQGGDAAKKHTKDCALMPNCKSSGYGVVSGDGKFLKFDADGDRFAEKMLGFASGKDDIRVAVDGEVKGGTIAVKAIQLL